MESVHYTHLLRILQVQCRKLLLEEGLSLAAVARLTPGFVGADLLALSREAAMAAVNRYSREERVWLTGSDVA